MLTRLACPDCDVLATTDANVNCWNCDKPMVPATGYQNPASSPMSHPILAAIADEVP